MHDLRSTLHLIIFFVSFDRKYGNFEKSKRFTVEIMNYFPKIELPSWKSTKEFIWNHRYKLIGAGVAGTAVVAWYTDIFGITTTKDRHLIDNVDNLPNELNSSSNKKGAVITVGPASCL